MRYPLAYSVSIVFAAILVGGFYLGGIGHFALPIVAYILIPPVDALCGLSRWPSERRIAEIGPATEWRYRTALVVSGLVSMALLGWALWAASHYTLLWWQFAGLALSIGINAGMTGIVVAHELVHRKEPLTDTLASLIMSTIGYAHYPVEHVYSHHARVGTMEDPVTARRGESVYGFTLRSGFGGLRAGWALEAARLSRAGRPTLSLSNRILRWQLFTILLVAGVALFLGPMSLLLLAAQALIAAFIFESVNYIEHYGLLRKAGPDGRPERIGIQHSWNSSHILTNVGLFNAGRHADHHLEPRRPYYKLRHYEDAPQLPYGYPAMILVAALPPLWFRIMDREIDRLGAGMAG
ncbi:alkane 1-monooxygenase [Parasphingopyxis marina]|uniref:Alkane 1-monooxygenase n=1 Tax=Parasphingopyxis marina TaxID=2761622 RepID=A0A842I1Z9_9SPHN|nr:alkane 1-monooxygenase [Parasphingopyxis marina]MBC2778743.1 alkane 1-monooxygenase [Parasphingopyxis marina]